MPWSKMEDVSDSVRGIDPPVTLEQANSIARVADALEAKGNKHAWAIAISNFKKNRGKKAKKEGVFSNAVGRLRAFFAPDAGLDVTHVAIMPKQLIPDGMNTGVKAFEANDKRYIVLWTSNAFKDREEETFSTKAWEDYVDRCDRLGQRGRVWFWHVKGSDYATIKWQGMVGRMLVELAEIDNTPRGEKMFNALQHPEQHPDLLPHGWGTSHGFVYRAGDKSAGVYNWVHKFESTTLPAHRASNVYGNVREVIEMPVTKEKAKGLEALLGEELAKEILADAEKASANLEKVGVEFKEADGESSDEEMTDEEKKKKSEEEEKKDEETSAEETKEQLFELEMDDDLLKEIASHVAVKDVVIAALKELLPAAVQQAVAAHSAELAIAVKEAVAEANIATKEQIVQQALSGHIKLTPYVASKSDDNLVPEDVVKEAEKANKRNDGDVVTILAKKMMAGQIS